MGTAYERHLPHEIPDGFPIFLTWNLKGALPKQVIAMLQRERDRLTKLPKLRGEKPRERRIREGKLIFAMADRFLDAAADGLMFLKDPTAARIVEDSILFGVPAHEINAAQDARGRVFWQDESYDHWARDDEEMMRIIAYIENNPVAAGLCALPEDWPWSSARFRNDWPPGQPFKKQVRLSSLTAIRR